MERLANQFKALADPLRLRILGLLSKSELAVGELAKILEIAQPRVSHHIKILKEAGIINMGREGSWTFLKLEEKQGIEVQELVSHFLKGMDLGKRDKAKLEAVLVERKERSRRFFEKAARRWEELEPEIEGTGLRYQALSCLLARGLTLADVGCGAGFMTKVIAKRAGKVILVDYSRQMLDKAKRELRDTGLENLDFRVGDLENLPIEDSEVNGAFANLVVHHAADLERAIYELSRILMPGGTVVVSDLLPHHQEWMREEYADLRLGLDPKEIEEMAGKAGLRHVLVEDAVDTLKVRDKKGKLFSLPMFVLAARKL